MSDEEIDRWAAIIAATPIPSKGPTLHLPAHLFCPDGTGRELDDETAERLARCGDFRSFTEASPPTRARIEVRRRWTPLQPMIAGIGMGVGAAVLLYLILRLLGA